MSCKFLLIKKNQLDKIRVLWEELNKIHLNDSVYFKNYFKTFTFEKRCERFSAIPDSDIRIEIIEVQ